MSVETVVTEGFGDFGDVAHVVTDGFGIGLAPSIPADATILTQAFGALTDASAFVVTEGFRSGTPTPTPTPTGQESTGPGIGLAATPRPPVDFVMNGGYMSGVRVPRFTHKNKMIKQAPNQWRKQPEDGELREMMGIYAMWKRS